MSRVDLGLALLRGRKVLAAVRHPTSRRALLHHRVAPAIEHLPLARTAPATVIDVGANRGQFTLALAEALPRARVVAIEPGPEAFAVLQEVTAPFGDRVQCHQVAVGAERSTATLHLAAGDDNSSLLPPGADQLALAREARTVDEVEVEVLPLDDLVSVDELEHPVLLKIDVQGTETDVLRGASTTLAGVDVVSIEVSFRELYVGHSSFVDVCSILAAAGLSLQGLENPTRIGGAIVQADALFRRGGDPVGRP